MSWDLNDDNFNVKEGGNKVFNGGVAGVVENCSASVTKKADGDHERAPDYKVMVADSEGRTLDIGFWYPDAEVESDADKKRKYGAKLSHVARCFMGQDFKFPQYNSGKEMLDGIMATLRPVAPKVPVRVLTTYGTSMGVKNYPIIRNYPRFIEPMSVNLDDSKLAPSSIDLMERPSADNEQSAVTTTAAASTDDGWD